MQVSSANRARCIPGAAGASFMYKLYSIGARTEPCGTPAASPVYLLNVFSYILELDPQKMCHCWYCWWHCLATTVYIAVARHWLVPSPWLASALFTATRLLPSNHCLPSRCLASTKRMWLVATMVYYENTWYTKYSFSCSSMPGSSMNLYHYSHDIFHVQTTKRHMNSLLRWQTFMWSVSSTHSCQLHHGPSGNTVWSSHDKSCDTCLPVSQ
jgi:hypothetical protein